MRNKWTIASILIVALIAVCGASLFATWQGIQIAQGKGFHFNGSWLEADTASAQATETKTINVQEPINLSVVTDHGSITVVAGKDGQVAVKAEKTAFGNSDADAQAALKGLKVVIEQEGKNIKVFVDQSLEVTPLHIGPVGGTVNFTITVPAKTAVTLNSRQGNLSLSGTSANAQLKTDSGNLNITDVTGEIVGQSNNGEITAQNIGATEMINLSSEFGSVAAENVTGSEITLSTSNGQLNSLKNIHATGQLKIISEFGDIDLVDGQAKTAEIRSNNGTIGLEKLNVDGNIVVKSDFGNLTLQEVNANAYDLNTQNGKINLDGAHNTIKAHSDFGSIEVLHAKSANIDISSNNGTITFSGSLGSGPHTVSSDFGNIQLTLPLESALNLSLKTDFGKITSSFNIAVNGTMDSKRWNGTINGGGATLTVKTNNGNITLQSSK